MRKILQRMDRQQAYLHSTQRSLRPIDDSVFATRRLVEPPVLLTNPARRQHHTYGGHCTCLSTASEASLANTQPVHDVTVTSACTWRPWVCVIRAAARPGYPS